MRLPDQVREAIRQVIGLSPDHPIQDDWPLYSLGATPYQEVRVCWILAVRIGLNPIELIAEVLVGSNLSSHTVPYLVHTITEVLANDSTASNQSAAGQNPSAISDPEWYGISSAEDAATG